MFDEPSHSFSAVSPSFSLSCKIALVEAIYVAQNVDERMSPFGSSASGNGAI